MDFFIKTLDFLENIMQVVAELDPGQSPKINEDLKELDLIRDKLKENIH